MIVAIGDIHGKFSNFIQLIENISAGFQSINFVQVGDFGVGFSHPADEWKTLNTLNTILLDTNSTLYVIRGNHDNPAFWSIKTGYIFSNIKFVLDNSIIALDDKMCYFAGGAISIDRCIRTQGVNYWNGEIYAKPETWNFLDTRIDILFTHDVYHGCSPYTTKNRLLLNWYEKDEHLSRDIMNEQNKLKELYETILNNNPNFSWYHGHYHESHATIIGNQKTFSLGIFETKEII